MLPISSGVRRAAEVVIFFFLFTVLVTSLKITGFGSKFCKSKEIVDTDFVSEIFRLFLIDFVSGKVIVAFVVEKDGSLTDIKVLRDIGFGTGKEAIRVLKLSPKWIPGQQNGHVVRSNNQLPISVVANSGK